MRSRCLGLINVHVSFCHIWACFKISIHMKITQLPNVNLILCVPIDMKVLAKMTIEVSCVNSCEILIKTYIM